MKSKTIMFCTIAGTILATTSIMHAADLPLRSHAFRHHAAKRSTAFPYRHGTIRHVRVAAQRHRHTMATRVQREGSADQASGPSGQSGIASVYSGGRTANGEVASAGRLTAAHRSLPFGTIVRVTHRGTGRSVVVRINDRGPFVRGRVIDLTPAAAHAIGFSGLAPVTLSVEGHG